VEQFADATENVDEKGFTIGQAKNLGLLRLHPSPTLLKHYPLLLRHHARNIFSQPHCSGQIYEVGSVVACYGAEIKSSRRGT
jgi:hypothetical protein